MTTKRCTHCLRELPYDTLHFNSNGKEEGKLRAQCKKCKGLADGAMYLRYKKEVMQIYSKGNTKCLCCGENNIHFLVIDHINGGGNDHRKAIRTSNIYKWLRAHDYPKGFQILCANCNQSKANGTKCLGHNKELV